MTKHDGHLCTPRHAQLLQAKHDVVNDWLQVQVAKDTEEAPGATKGQWDSGDWPSIA